MNLGYIMKTKLLLYALIALNSIILNTFADNADLYTEWYERGVEFVKQGNVKAARESFSIALLYNKNGEEAQKGIHLSDEWLKHQKPAPKKSPAIVAPARKSYLPKNEVELIANGVYYSPRFTELFESGFGAEAQYRYWKANNVGFAFSIGAAKWQTEEYSENDEGIEVNGGGSLNIIPLGASILTRAEAGKNINLVCEAGLRYIITQSDIYIEGNDGFNQVRFEFDATDGIIALFGIGYDVEFTENLRASISGGYQFDLLKSELEFMNFDSEEIEMKAYYIRAGISASF